MVASQQQFERFAGGAALAGGVGSILYAVAFLSHNPALSGGFLLLGGTLSIIVLFAVYQRIRATSPAIAGLGMILVVIGAYGAIAHGGYDLAIRAAMPINASPSPTDPRGLLTFGITGLGVLCFAWVMRQSQAFPAGLALLAAILGVVSLALYLVRLIIVDPGTVPFGYPAIAAAGFIIGPVWYFWLGLTFLRSPGKEKMAGRG
jgi:hypothetical protein